MEFLKDLLPIIVTAINTIGLLYIAFKKSAVELKKTDVETDNEFIEGAERSAKLVEELLTQRINDLKAELATEREIRAKELAAEREARKKEGEYLRKRIKEAEREARDYRAWASNLAKQVISSGGKPVAFVPTIDESENNIPTINMPNDPEKK